MREDTHADLPVTAMVDNAAVQLQIRYTSNELRMRGRVLRFRCCAGAASASGANERRRRIVEYGQRAQRLVRRHVVRGVARGASAVADLRRNGGERHQTQALVLVALHKTDFHTQPIL